ncbi:phospholipid-binding protein MlaC [Vibrio sp. S17_S38]|uniref:phospholipid-binding protein MlaC n=1 Tax=Vibrio sp. S17_S38 TaxID=2720229 RepID=UPI0016802305|nr:phospholipid-binding protein MlaC [Vibrio sp. S17_S38]MBD1574479.1 phospholipid-binding protein MlaC [Vibrio sp. S17_S38]
MNWIKQTLALITLLLVSIGLQAKEVDATNPYQMMHQVADQTFSRLKAEQADIRKNPNQLKTIVDEEMMPYVNYQYAALKLLGPNLRGADKKDVEAFINEFRAYLITSYAQVLTQYSNQKIQFEKEQSIESDRRIINVRVEIIDPSRPSIKLDFTLLKNKNSGEWKAYDMVAEGISLLSSKQSEWNTKIRQDGIPSVTKELAELAQKDITFETKK